MLYLWENHKAIKKQVQNDRESLKIMRDRHMAGNLLWLTSFHETCTLIDKLSSALGAYPH
jgi:hypothetical protein